MTELKHNYNAEVGNRQPLDNGSVKYPLKVFVEKEDGEEEKIVDTTYTVTPRQEKRLEKMIKTFTVKKAKEYEQNVGKDHSDKTFSI